jgi:ribosome maturation factor RimP
MAMWRLQSAPPEVIELLEPVVRGLGYELWGVEFDPRQRHPILRVYIEHPQGITLRDCERVSRQIGSVLDVEDPIPGAYTLEVSSPGLDRPLFTEEQLRRHAGEVVQVRTERKLDDRRRFKGRVRECRDGWLEIEDAEGATRIPLDAIARVRLVPEL